MRPSRGNGHRTREGVQRISKEGVIGGNETPFVLFDVVDLTAHLVVSTDYIYLVLVRGRKVEALV